jgi:CRISPR-associated protein Cmr5
MPQTTDTSKPTLDQRRAKHAWQAVTTAKQQNEAAFKDFCMHAKRLPMRIMASGLGQALAFLKAKDYAPQLLQELGDWVLDKRANPASTKPKPTDEALLRQIVEKDSDFLRRATDETIAYLQWLNRFAEAEGPVEGD